MDAPPSHPGASRAPGYAFRIAGSEAPDPDEVHRVHDRYLLEVVEGLGLCPFARRSRELGRVHRPLFAATAVVPPHAVAKEVERVLAAFPDVEIILPTFVLGERTWPAPESFDAYVKEVRERHLSHHDPATFYMVGFHPAALRDPSRPASPDNLVALLRRSPDPVIQCVRCSVLDTVREQARATAASRLRAELARLDPEVAALLSGSVQTDSELSADIARHNFEAVGKDEGRAQLEHALQQIMADRDRTYGPAAVR